MNFFYFLIYLDNGSSSQDLTKNSYLTGEINNRNENFKSQNSAYSDFKMIEDIIVLPLKLKSNFINPEIKISKLIGNTKNRKKLIHHYNKQNSQMSIPIVNKPDLKYILCKPVLQVKSNLKFVKNQIIIHNHFEKISVENQVLDNKKIKKILRLDSMQIDSSLKIKKSIENNHKRIISNLLYEYDTNISSKSITNKSKKFAILHNSKISHPSNNVKNKIHSIENSRNHLTNYMIKLYNTVKYSAHVEKFDSGAHLNNFAPNNIKKFDGYKDTHDAMHKKIFNNPEAKNKKLIVKSKRKNKVLEKYIERVNTINTIIIKDSKKHYTFKNWEELKNDILEHLINLKKFIIKSSLIDSIWFETILYKIKRILRMLIIWESFMPSIPPYVKSMNICNHNELKIIIHLIKETKNCQILFSEFHIYNENSSYKYVFKEKELICQNLIQELLFECFKAFVIKIQKLESLSDIIKRNELFKLHIIRQILREFMYFTFESMFLEDFRTLYKHILYCVLSKKEKKDQKILQDFKIKDYKDKYHSNYFNPYLFNFRYLFMFKNTYNLRINEVVDEKNKSDGNKIIKLKNKRLKFNLMKMTDLKSSLLKNYSFEIFFYNLCLKKCHLEIYLIMCLEYLEKLIEIQNLTEQIKKTIENTDITIKKHIKTLKYLNKCHLKDKEDQSKTIKKKRKMLRDIYQKLNFLICEIESFEIEMLIK